MTDRAHLPRACATCNIWNCFCQAHSILGREQSSLWIRTHTGTHRWGSGPHEGPGWTGKSVWLPGTGRPAPVPWRLGFWSVRAEARRGRCWCLALCSHTLQSREESFSVSVLTHSSGGLLEKKARGDGTRQAAVPAGVRPAQSKNILCSTSIVLLSGAFRLWCSTEQLKFWPEYKEDGKRTELRADAQPSARSSSCDWLLMLLPLFPTCQITTAAGATLCTKHTNSVYSSPFSHPVRESTVMFGRAVRERWIKAQGVVGGGGWKLSS